MTMKNLLYIFIAVLALQSCSKDNSSNSLNNGSGFNSGTTGQGGSLARFTIAQNHLYIVDDKKLYAYSLEVSTQPQLKGTVNIGSDIETIYSYEDKLYIGSQNAMFIYSIANPGQPDMLGNASHVRACDPVVANDNMAYVTVRGGSTCGGTQNALLVYDVQNVLNPRLVNNIPLSSPWGLGLRNNKLYVCDGPAGLKVFSLSDPTTPRLTGTVRGETCYDVIPTSDVLVAMVEGGTSLYGYAASGDSLTHLAKMAN